jgi:hypothetical protein
MGRVESQIARARGCGGMLAPAVVRNGLAERGAGLEAFPAGIAGLLKPIHHEHAWALATPIAL